MPDKEPSEIINDRELILSQAMFRALTGIAEMKAHVLTHYNETVPVSRVLKELDKITKAISSVEEDAEGRLPVRGDATNG